MKKGGESSTFNCGYGHGYSVREVLDTVEKISGNKMNIIEEPRRAGDPPMLIAKADRVRKILNWEPQFDDLDIIVKTSLAWEEHKRY